MRWTAVRAGSICVLVAASACSSSSESGDGGGDPADVAGNYPDFGAVEDTGAADVPLWETDLHCELDPGRSIPAGLTFGDSSGCNQCWCYAGGHDGPCTGNTCEYACTAALCPAPTSTVGADFPRCRTHDDCGPATMPGFPISNVCFFEPGCGDPMGYCVRVQTSCPRALPAAVDPATADLDSYVCGCDGNTYPGSCPTMPLSATGPCP